MQIDIFLSYARSDKKIAQEIYQALEEAGLVVWWDFGLPPGADFSREIAKVVDISIVTLVLWSSSSIKSRWVLGEADHADKNGKLIPIRIEPVKVPLPFGRLQSPLLTDFEERDAIAALVNQIVEGHCQVVERTF